MQRLPSDVQEDGCVRVFIVESQPLLRRGLCDVLTKCPSVTLVGVSASLPSERLPEGASPHVVLVDLLAVADIPQAFQQLQRLYPHANIVLLGEVEACEEALEALRCGARGVLLKNVTADALVQAIHLVASGYTVWPTFLVPHLTDLAHRSVRLGTEGSGCTFTAREWDILRLLMQGYTTRQIAQRLVVSESTVKTHVHNMLRKAGVHNRAELVALVMQEFAHRVDPSNVPLHH